MEGQGRSHKEGETPRSVGGAGPLPLGFLSRYLLPSDGRASWVLDSVEGCGSICLAPYSVQGDASSIISSDSVIPSIDMSIVMC